jgi:hypothetical protein
MKKRETGKTNIPVETNRKNTEINKKKNDQVKDQRTVKTKESVDLNKTKQRQNTQVKRENTKVTSNDQVKKNEVKDKNRNNDQQNKTNDTKVNTDRTKEKDNSRERSKR